MSSSLFVEALSRTPQDLLVPTEDLKAAAFKAVKDSLDPIASQYSIFDQLHIDDLDAEQIWAQARMVVDGAIEKLLGDVISKKRKHEEEESDVEDEDDSDDSDEEGFSDIRNRQDRESESDNEELEVVEYNEDEDEEVNESEEDMETLVGDEIDYSEDEEEEENTEGEDDDDNKPKSELDEGLFRLADFQQQILALEKDGEEAEEEDINYFADANDQDSESDGDMKYDDFFAPPPKKRGVRSIPIKKTQTDTDEEVSDEEEEFAGLDIDARSKDIDNAMKNARKELFADDDDEDEDTQTTEKLSTFEKQQLEIMKQIQQLEEENIAEKSWAVRGEVKAKDRPLDSLIETDLDFERNAKPVPVITQDVTESLEDMIRRRIKEEQYDDIPRRLPDTLPEFRKAKLVDVQETKSQKSLAELYEEDYVKENNPDSYKDAESEQLKEAHQEIIDMYNSLSRKLDALCSWNYTPKAPKPAISIVTNAPAISMEEAQPTAMATESMLAPQEVYQPAATSKREVVGANGLPVAKAEMSREERKREKRHQKAKRAKVFKEREEKDKSKSQKEGSKSNIIDTLKKGNVTVIGKKGEKRDISGKLVKDKARLEGSNLKL